MRHTPPHASGLFGQTGREPRAPKQRCERRGVFFRGGPGLLVVLACCAGLGAELRPWGTARSGLQLAIWPEQPLIARGAGSLGGALRNCAEVPVRLGNAEDGFAFLLLQQGKTQFFSERLDLPSSLPAELAPDAKISLPALDLGRTKLYRYGRDVNFLRAYRRGLAPDVPPAGELAERLQPGPAGVRLCLVLPAGGRTLMLKSNLLALTVGPPDFANLPDEQRKAFVAELLGQFSRSAFAARNAHRTAVKIGPAIVPVLREAVGQRERPGFARAWLAVSLADIRDPRSARALVKLLDEQALEVYVAYHGPKQRDATLDAAILARARQRNEPRLTGYALLGYLCFRKQVPAELLQRGLGSNDPRVRAAAVEHLGRIAGATGSVETLLHRLEDPAGEVRATAARILGCLEFDSPPPAVLNALIEALANPDDLTRLRVSEALVNLTGQGRVYTPSASAAERQAVLKDWRDWHAGRARPASGR